MSQATRQARAAEIAALQSGVGQFVLRNKTQSDLILPKLSLDPTPRKMIGPGQCFIGDSYHLDNMRDLVIVEQVLDSGDPEPPAEPVPAKQSDKQQASTESRPHIGNLDAAI